ncbi:MAG: metal-dependent transcriptional regulator [Bryobacterales bacterium]|nr:metal-dependent transcriptional regulator [Bryobacterales bacterium]
MTGYSIIEILIALLLLSVIAIVVLRFVPNSPIQRYFQMRREKAERALWEDVLRQIVQMEQDGRIVSTESLAGTMGRSVPELRRVMGRMGEHDLIVDDSQKVRLTKDGKRWALHVLRAHRLWESYLADEARLPMSRLHHQAEAVEHQLSESDLAALDAHLGHPVEDPHGDPIPTADGELAHPRGTALSQWEGGAYVRVVHLEDEPPGIFNRILSKGIRPGLSLRLEEVSPQSISVLLDGSIVTLEQDLLPNVEVAEDTELLTADPRVTRLSQLPTGQPAEILALSDAIRGFSRRRLLDFGVTPGTKVSPILDNPFGDPRAFRIRGTTIGIRNEQAREIWVRRDAAVRSSTGGSR